MDSSILQPTGQTVPATSNQQVVQPLTFTESGTALQPTGSDSLLNKSGTEISLVETTTSVNSTETQQPLTKNDNQAMWLVLIFLGVVFIVSSVAIFARVRNNGNQENR